MRGKKKKTRSPKTIYKNGAKRKSFKSSKPEATKIWIMTDQNSQRTKRQDEEK